MDLRIASFYEGKTIFITGATGFMGKALVEKLLRSCSGIKKIYILIRSKKGLSSKQRWDKIMNENELFEIMRNKSPSYMDKVVPIDGDITEKDLGIKKSQNKILECVNIIFHAAASVRFNDTLQYATNINVTGTKSVVDFALGLKDLISFVQVSTAYCNCHLATIEEKVYPIIADWEKTCDIVSNTDPIILESLTAKYIHPFPNTYVFAKHLSEHVVNDIRKKLPIVIFRPSIEPIPGWHDNFNGPVGLVTAIGKGLARSACMNEECLFDWIPVDISIRALVTSAWRKSWSGNEIDVYNCASNFQSVPNKTVVETGLQNRKVAPSAEMIWYPNFTPTTSTIWFRIRAIFTHFLLALFVDFYLIITNKKPRLMKIQIKIHRAMQSLSYFMTNEWNFNNSFFLGMNESINQKDRESFGYFIKKDDFATIFQHSIKFGRRVLVGEPDCTIPQALKNLHRWYIVDKVFKLTLVAIICFIMYKIVSLKCL